MLSNPVHMRGIIENIEVACIQHSVFQLRDIGDISQLASSIKENGLLHPIIVRSTGNLFEIVAGNRRFQACKKLGMKKVPCHVMELSDKQAFEISLIENIQRKTMNPIEEAEAYDQYIKNYGWGSTSELAKYIGRSQEYVSKRIKLLQLPKEIQQEVIRRRIKTSIAEELAFIEDKEEQSRLAQLVTVRHLTVKKVRELSKSKDELLENTDTVISSHNNTSALFDKTLVSLKLTLNRIDEIIDEAGNNMMIRELLMHYRLTIHAQIDSTIRNKRKYLSYFSI